MTYAHATLRWIPSTDGGRRQPLAGRRYMAPAAIGDGPPEWTLVVDRQTETPQAEENVLVHFLMDDAPHHRLVEGVQFRLFEGPRAVAEGNVVGVYDLNSAAWSGGAGATA